MAAISVHLVESVGDRLTYPIIAVYDGVYRPAIGESIRVALEGQTWLYEVIDVKHVVNKRHGAEPVCSVQVHVKPIS